MLRNLQNFAKSQKLQLDILVDFEECCKTLIFLQRSAPIQPKTSEILPKFAENWQLTYGSRPYAPTVCRMPYDRGVAGGVVRGLFNSGATLAVESAEGAGLRALR